MTQQVNQTITDRLNNALTAQTCTLLTGTAGNIVLIQAQVEGFHKGENGRLVEVLVDLEDLKKIVDEWETQIPTKENQ